MFEKTLDSKSKYTDNDDYELIDLGENIFSTDAIFNAVGYTIYKVSKDLEMRPDLAARAAYNDDDNTELLLKYNNIQNPFTLKEDDVLIFPSSTQITKNVGIQTETQKKTADDLIRQSKKYLDSSKLPDTVGSQKNETSISKSSGSSSSASNLTGNTATRRKEANLAPLGSEAIKEVNGKLYFGTNTGMKCASDGVSTAEYLKAILKNSTNK